MQAFGLKLQQPSVAPRPGSTGAGGVRALHPPISHAPARGGVIQRRVYYSKSTGMWRSTVLDMEFDTRLEAELEEQNELGKKGTYKERFQDKPKQGVKTKKQKPKVKKPKKRKREFIDDDLEILFELKTKKQYTGRTFSDSLKGEFAAAFLTNARALAPVVDNGSNGLDAVAEHIVPSNNLNCAAVSDPGAGNYLYATNSNSPTPLNIAAHPSGRGFTRINNPWPRLHAEMRIYLNNPNVTYIGISKQCCQLCALALAVVGVVGTRGCHGGIYDTGWTTPAFIKNNPNNLVAFLGADAFAIYNTLSDGSKADALRLIETNIKQYTR